MRATAYSMTLAIGLLAGCASYPTPVQHMADAEGAARSAQDQGATNDPQGQLHVKLAQEEIARAKQLIASGDNEQADTTLARAKSDAELAIAEAQDTVAEREAQKAAQDVADLRSRGNAQSSSITTTTTAGVVATPAMTTTTTTSTGGQK